MQLALILLAATALAAEDRPRKGPRMDMHSYGNPSEVAPTRIELELAVDFEARTLAGTATLDLPPGKADRRLVLDTRELTILAAETAATDTFAPTHFALGVSDPILGAPLTVDLPKDAKRVRIRYRTAPGAKAVQWVQAAGTAGGKHPFMFTQSQAIQARSWMPTMDSPGVRMTYGARVTVPAGLVAVMSAESKGREGDTFAFEMPQAIPAYLIALAVGDLKFQETGPRTGVWAEPSVLRAAASEFADTETMVKAAEARYGPYRWGRYDILVLPPSFPFGGMENPRLTFATPTVLAGDKSLVSLIAHELAHSWSGNLVTNATWRDFWLNEGFTTYIEWRIIEDLYGPDRAAMEQVLGRGELMEEIRRFPPADEVLHIDLDGRDPDDGMTRVPYEKGALLLTTLERAYGREAFDAYLKGYFDRHAFTSITTADFEDDLRKHLMKPGKPDPLDLRTWVHEPGLPGDAPMFASARFDAVDRDLRRWLDGAPATALDTRAWSTQEWLRFVRALPPKLPASRLADLDGAMKLTERPNAEVAAAWLVAATRADYKPAEARVEAFLTTIGRRKFLMPLYTELMKTPAGKARALAIFDKARPFYHPIAAESLARLLGR